MVIETTSPVWQTGALTFVLHPHLFSALHGSRTRTLLLLRTCFLDKRVYQFHQKGKLFKYPDRDSNPDHKIRSLAFYSVELSGHLCTRRGIQTHKYL